MRSTRIPPRLGAHQVQTYQVAAPPATHTRSASCAEVDCPAHAHGWTTTVDEATELGQRQAAYIRHECSPATATVVAPAGRRRYVESRTQTGLTAFTFPAGQTCFASHTVPLERPALYIVRGGDWRGNPAGVPGRTHRRPQDWVEDFAGHQDRLAQLQRKG